MRSEVRSLVITMTQMEPNRAWLSLLWAHMTQGRAACAGGADTRTQKKSQARGKKGTARSTGPGSARSGHGGSRSE